MNTLRATQRQRKEPLDPSLSASPDHAPDANLARSELRAALLDALAHLSPIQREVVLLADLSQLSHAAIAQAVGISIHMSRRHLSDARLLLRKKLGAQKANL